MTLCVFGSTIGINVRFVRCLCLDCSNFCLENSQWANFYTVNCQLFVRLLYLLVKSQMTGNDAFDADSQRHHN